jgi:tryptophan halogenase
MKKFVIIGGGTAGWITALYMQKYYPNDSITLIESEEIGTIGFGEGTTPMFTGFLKEVGIDEKEFHESVSSTIKVGIDFKHWAKDKSTYLHDFNIDYPDRAPITAYHFNNFELKEFFRKKCIGKINHVIGNVLGFEKNENDIKIIKTNVGDFESDFVLDCSGIQRLVIGKEYGEKWISCNEQLRVNSVLTFSIKNKKRIEKFTNQRTEATALKNGWLWKIPLNDVTNYGYVFDGTLINEEESKKEINEIFGNDISFNRHFKFESGYYDNMWVGNSVCIGLSSGFFEPIEATSIMISIIQIGTLIGYDFKDKEKYNQYIKNIYESTFSFIRYHYVCDRTDTEFWKIYNSLPIPTQLSKILTKNLRLKSITNEEFYSILPDSIFSPSSYNLLSQYNFENKKEKTLV